MARHGVADGVLITQDAPTGRTRGAVWRPLAALYPGYFALVMATGIVAIALDLVGLAGVARVLSWLDVAAYLLLVLLFAARFARFGGRALADLVDHERGPGYFTWVAGSCVLGSQLLLLGDRAGVAWVLWGVGLALWLLISYVFFAAVTLRRVKPPLGDAISGAWLLAVVATQSVALLGAQLVSRLEGDGDGLLFLSLCLFLIGTVLYLLVIGLIFYRFSFVPIDAAHLSPPYWINMGALAITTLAGATLMARQGAAPFLDAVHPFLVGFTLLFWAFGSWWIPLLVAFGVWRHLLARYPLRYAPEYWGLVFPLGMYSVATHQMGVQLQLAPLQRVAALFAYLGLAAWALTFLGMLASWVTRPRTPPGTGAAARTAGGEP